MTDLRKTFTLRNSRGFSLLEMVIVLGLFGFAASGVVNLSLQSNLNARRAEIEVEKVQFLSSLQQYLLSGPASLELINLQFTPSVSTEVWQNLVLSGWKVNNALEVKSATRFKNFELVKFEAMINDPAAMEEVRLPVQPLTTPVTFERLKKNMLTVRAEIKTEIPRRTTKHLIEVPVITDNAGKIRYLQPKILETCASMGGVMDSSTGTCKINSCLMQGTFVRGGTYETKNIYTNSLSCPVGSVETETSVTTSTSSPSCGKKCVPSSSTSTSTWYVCLKCP